MKTEDIIKKLAKSGSRDDRRIPEKSYDNYQKDAEVVKVRKHPQEKGE